MKKLLRLLPAPLRNRLVRRHLQLPASYPPNVVFRLVNGFEEYEAAYRLLHDSYVAAGFMDPAESGVRLTPYHCLGSTSVIAALVDGKVVGTISMIRDSNLGMPMDKIFDLSAYRSAGKRLVEVSSLSIAPEFRGDHGYVLHGLCRYVIMYGRDYFKCDALVIAVNPKMVAFYEAFYGFTRLSRRPVASYGFVKGAPAVGLIFDLQACAENLARLYQGAPEHRDIHKFVFGRPAPENIFPERRTPHINDAVITWDLLDYFVRTKTNLHKLWPIEERLLVVRASRFDPDVISIMIGENVLSRDESRRRFAVYCPIQVRIAGEPGPIAAMAWDVSAKGVRIRLDESGRVLPKGPLEFEIEFGTKEKIAGRAEAVWSQADGFAGLRISEANKSWQDMINRIAQESADRTQAMARLRVVAS